MVNRRTGTFSMEVKKTVDRGVNTFSLSRTSHCCSPESKLNLRLGPVCFQRRVLKMHNDYYFTDIKGTPFRWSQASLPRLWADSVPDLPAVSFPARACSVGVALSRGHGKYFFRGNVSVETGM